MKGRGVVASCAILMQITLFLTVESAYESDRIVSLPGQPKVDFQQFSGYVNVDEYQKRFLFYYFVEAESYPASKPLVLWLNGGPGCSSVGAGAFAEHGPFKPHGDVLIRNYYSWNKVANILYLESPAGVGFSFSSNSTFYHFLNDTITAQDNFIFLRRWLEKFPEYIGRDFYITGESYAGHYVPQLTSLIIESDYKFLNLKAIAIGNPLLDFETDIYSAGEYYWSHGLISDSTYGLVQSTCNTSQIFKEQISGTLSSTCSRVNALIDKEISELINPYGINLDVCVTSSQSQLRILSNLSKSRSKSRSSNPTKVLPNSEGSSEKIDVCLLDEVTTYLNRPDVQQALHAQLVGVQNWTLCSDVVNYDLRNLGSSTIPLLGSIVQSGIKVLIFSGDQDTVVPFIGTRILVGKLATQLGLYTSLPYTIWIDNKQVGGWTQVYGDVLSFATIRGAAHQAPFSSPERSLTLFTAFLGGKPLTHSDTTPSRN